MRKSINFFFWIFMIISLILSCKAFSQQVTVDISKLPDQAKLAVINANKVAHEQAQPKEIIKGVVDSYGLKELPKIIADSIQQVCNILNIEVNKFADSKVGYITMMLIIFHFVGKKLLAMVSIFILLIVFNSLIIWYAKKTILPVKLIDVKPDKSKVISLIKNPYHDKYEENSNTKLYLGWMAAIFNMALTFVLILAITL